MSYPLTSKLDNGATVSDWLGTAMVAARAADNAIESVRMGTAKDPVERLAQAIGHLEQALEEARTIQQHVAHVRAYQPVAYEHSGISDLT
jgi:hypothetical protein